MNKCICEKGKSNPNCPEHGIVASNARENDYWKKVYFPEKKK
jgi:hypothetical protein